MDNGFRVTRPTDEARAAQLALGLGPDYTTRTEPDVILAALDQFGA